MVRAADLPYASRRLHFRSQPLDPPGGAHPRWPPDRADPLDQPGCRGAEDPRGHGAPRFDGPPPDHRQGCGFSAPAPPRDSRAGYRKDAPGGVAAAAPPPEPDRHMSTGTSSRRHLPLAPHPGASPPTRSLRGERRREHRHRARDESSRSPHLRLPLGGSRSPPPSSSKREPYRLEDERKGRSNSLPSSKRYRLEDGRKSSSSGECRRWYDDDQDGTGGRHGDGHHTQELTYLPSCDHGHRHHDCSVRKISPCDHGRALHHSPQRKLPSPLPIVMSQLDDGYKSPSSPTYRCEDELEDVGKGTHDDCGDENCDPDWLDRAGASDAPESEITGRAPDFKHEGSSYDALVDDFMDAVLKNWHEPVDPNVTISKEAFQNQTKRFAELALKRYNKNKNNKVKYSFVEAISGAAIFEDNDLYAHVNFFANAKNGPKVLVFAELHQVGSRPNSMVLTSFHVLDEKRQLSGRYHQDRSSRITQDWDMSHCYACGDDIKHPDGSCYKAGHLVDASRYRYD